MNREPDEQDNLERRRELLREEEAFRLQQEQGRLEAARKSNTFAWIVNAIAFLVGLLEVLLVLRFVLRVAVPCVRPLPRRCAILRAGVLLSRRAKLGQSRLLPKA